MSLLFGEMSETHVTEYEQMFQNMPKPDADGNVDINSIVQIVNRHFPVYRANGIVIGKTGVGKTTLINAVFKEPIDIEAGIGSPSTMHIEEHRTKNGLLSLFDTRGFELANYREIVDEVKYKITMSNKENDPENHIHFVWYCFNENDAKYTDGDIDFIKYLEKESAVPVIIVLTQNINDDTEFKNIIQKEFPSSHVIPVLAVDKIVGRAPKIFHIPSHGLETLVARTMMHIPEGQQNAFLRVTRKNEKLKLERSDMIISTACLMAAVAAAVPFPMSDAYMIAPIQIGMITSISTIYEIDVNDAMIMTLIAGVGGTVISASAGKSLAKFVLSFVAGSGGLIVGSLINATVASSLTKGMGEKYRNCIIKDQKNPVPLGWNGIMTDFISLMRS